MSARTRTSSGLGRLERIEPPATTPGADCYRSAKGCTIIVAREPAGRAPTGIWLPPDARLLWHLSIAHRRRYPTWDEIADARYELTPAEVTMAMLLPPPEHYVNANAHCFHLWQIDDRRAP